MAHMGEKRYALVFLVEKHEDKNNSEDQAVDSGIVLN